MTKFQKIGLAIVAFCLTVAVTRRVQQEVDKEAFLKLQQANARSLDEGLWEYQTVHKNGKYLFAHLVADQPTTYWYASLNEAHEQGSNPFLLLTNHSPIRATVEKETGNLRVSFPKFYGSDDFFFEIDYQQTNLLEGLFEQQQPKNPLDALPKQQQSKN